MNDQQREAARLVAMGWGNEAVANAVGVSARTIFRWKRDVPGFVQAVSRDLDPTVRSTLEAALQACKRDGTPDWPTRVSAAKALAALGDGQPDPEASTGAPSITFYHRDPAAEAAA